MITDRDDGLPSLDIAIKESIMNVLKEYNLSAEYDMEISPPMPDDDSLDLRIYLYNIR